MLAGLVSDVSHIQDKEIQFIIGTSHNLKQRLLSVQKGWLWS